MKKIISIILLALTLCLVGCNKIYSFRKKDAVDKCKEEFVFDYDEEILFVRVGSTVKNKKELYIVEIYGEKTYATYIYCDGELWNYENQSN